MVILKIDKDNKFCTEISDVECIFFFPGYTEMKFKKP